MSPTAEPATQAAAAEIVLPEELLEDGEVVILAVKPSPWFALLVSAPVLGLLGVVAGGTWLAEGSLDAVPLPLVLLVCVGGGLLRLLIGCMQWIGRLYVLTNRRALRIRGVYRPDVLSQPLREVREVLLTGSLPERTLGLGTVVFDAGDRAPGTAGPGAAHPSGPVGRSGDPAAQRTGGDPRVGPAGGGHPTAPMHWAYLSEPAEVERIINETIRRTRR